VDTGDFVVVLNAGKVRVTGRKAEAIEYETYSKHPGGRHLYAFEFMRREHPEKIIELAVRRMLPKNKLARHMLGKLKIYRGDTHPHQAQQPKELKLS
jgi:large subunit ribosomal protein L13